MTRTSRILALVLMVAPASAHAAPGTLVLPLAGLAIDTPRASDTRYVVTSSWRIDDTSMAFEGGDTIDELRHGKVVAATWVTIGWFGVEACVDALRYAPIEDAWELANVQLWGSRWAVRGGIYRGGSEMNGRSIVTLCADHGERKQIVLSRFAPEATRAPTRTELVRDVRKSEVMRRVYRAFLDRRTVATAPAREAVNRGGLAARREVALLWSQIALSLPDDGFVWTTGTDLSGVDRFERMAPALPELSVAVVRIDAPADEPMTCAAAFELLGGDPMPRAALGLPAGWEAGRTTVGAHHRTLGACHTFPWGLLAVGVTSAVKAIDFAPVAPLLEAIAVAANVGERTALSRAGLSPELFVRPLSPLRPLGPLGPSALAYGWAGHAEATMTYERVTEP